MNAEELLSKDWIRKPGPRALGLQFSGLGPVTLKVTGANFFFIQHDCIADYVPVVLLQKAGKILKSVAFRGAKIVKALGI